MWWILDSSLCSLSSMSHSLLLNLSTTFIPQSFRDTSNHSRRVRIMIVILVVSEITGTSHYSSSGSSKIHH